MKLAAHWIAEKIGERPEDFAPGEQPEMVAWVEGIQKDAQPAVARQDIIDIIARAFVFGRVTPEAVQHAADAVMALVFPKAAP